MVVKISGISAGNLYLPEPLEKKSFVFSAGEIQVRIPPLKGYESVLIESRYPTSQDIMEIVLTLDAINNSEGYEGSVTLFLPYLPYSRQDRVCYPGEAFSLYAFARVLSTQLRPKDKIITWDVHSNVSINKFSNLCNITADSLITKLLKKEGIEIDSSTVVVSPDKGAINRANLVAEAIGAATVIYGEKIRNPEDGKILGITVSDTEGGEPFILGKKVLIVDDICDGGRTFIELAKVLRDSGAQEITLYVTHGIFSKGFDVFNEGTGLLIDKILTPNLFPGVNPPLAASAEFITPGDNPQVAPIVYTL